MRRFLKSPPRPDVNFRCWPGTRNGEHSTEKAIRRLPSVEALVEFQWEGQLAATQKYRIWAQGATDQVGHRNYLAQLLPHMKASTDPDFEVEFKTMTPSVTTVHALSEFRFSREVIRGAIQAERENYDVFFMNHFQDVGLYEARAAVKMPVLGLGEATLLHACMMGRKLGLIAINPAFIPAHNEQIYRYGLQQRVAGLRAMEANISDYMEAFSSPAKRSELNAVFEREARRLIDCGADVIVPTGGIPMMLFSAEPGANVDGAPIVNGVTVVIKAAEMAVKLKRLGVPVVSRIPQSGFALPSDQTLQEFLSHG
jgi:Asp/Glu/hydantoin racemase